MAIQGSIYPLLLQVLRLKNIHQDNGFNYIKNEISVQGIDILFQLKQFSEVFSGI